MSQTKISVLPAALPPAPSELEVWTALSRDEQLGRYREALEQADCAVATDDSMADLLAIMTFTNHGNLR